MSAMRAASCAEAAVVGVWGGECGAKIASPPTAAALACGAACGAGGGVTSCAAGGIACALAASPAPTLARDLGRGDFDAGRDVLVGCFVFGAATGGGGGTTFRAMTRNRDVTAAVVSVWI